VAPVLSASVTAPATSSVPTRSAAQAFSASDLALLAVIIIWGSNYTVVKESLEAIPAPAFMALRFALAAVAMAVVLHVQEGWKPLPRATLLKLVVLGLVGHTVYQVCFVLGVANTTASNSGMLTAGTPVVIALLGAMLGLDRLSRPLLIGLVLAIPGMLLIISARGAGAGGGPRLGDFLILASSLCWALYTVGIRWVGPGVSALRVTALSMLVGAPGVVAVGLPSVSSLDLSAISLGAWAGVVYSALVPLVLAYVVWGRSVQSVGASRTAIYNSGLPVVAALTAWGVRGEQPTWLQAVGAALVITGVLVSRRR
jgi:drug/metabolite transporter (DMT)-like permease